MINNIQDFIDLLDENKASIEDLTQEIIGFDWDYTAKKFKDMEIEHLDIIEMVMEIERRYRCMFNDNFLELMYDMNPNEVAIPARRERKLNQLGI
jgi:acyl carrier protein